MLKQAIVDQEEEALRLEIRALSDSQREIFYANVKPRLRDPDTYAALNWFFIAGIHHFYIGRWQWGVIDILTFFAGVGLIIGGFISAGIFLIVAISLLELWALFRSQIIIQHWNNQLYRAELNNLLTKR